KVGEPNLQDERMESAPALVKSLTAEMSGQPSQDIGVQAVSAGTGTPDANEKAPGSPSTTASADGTAPTPAPAQVNEIQKSGATQPQATTDSTAAPADPQQESSSKKKEKKGLRKLIPF
ncbi:MAG TPA: hypothetical protein VKU42_07630, partial [Candidatus Angelobacter sp.]|nr:hypothetical protein [Candidatus Angelobacter sp.]